MGIRDNRKYLKINLYSIFCASIVQWLRHRPVAAETRVQFPVGAFSYTLLNSAL